MTFETLLEIYTPLFVWGHLICMIILVSLIISLHYNFKKIYDNKNKKEKKENQKQKNNLNKNKNIKIISKASSNIKEKFNGEQQLYDNYGHILNDYLDESTFMR